MIEACVHPFPLEFLAGNRESEIFYKWCVIGKYFFILQVGADGDTLYVLFSIVDFVNLWFKDIARNHDMFCG